MKKIRVWDLPIRLFHWALVFFVVAAIVTVKIGGEAMVWHFRCGYAVLALLLFRLFWGIVGSTTAQFRHFWYTPREIWDYLRGQSTIAPRLGHNPVGSLSVFGLLGILIVQVASGLFANDEIASEGPLAKHVSSGVSQGLTFLHADISGNMIYAMIALHVLAIAGYLLFKKINLVTPMITGDTQTDSDVASVMDSAAMRWRAMGIALISAGLVALLIFVA